MCEAEPQQPHLQLTQIHSVIADALYMATLELVALPISGGHILQPLLTTPYYMQWTVSRMPQLC